MSVNDLNQRWIVTAQDASDLLQTGATLVDARSLKNPLDQKLQGAVSVRWKDFSQPEEMHQGKLLNDISILQSKLQALGISNDVPVVVFGDPAHGWGEEGRIVWMLRTLGHKQAVWVDGGIRALINADFPTSRTLTDPMTVSPGNFTAQLDNRWQIGRDQVKQLLEEDNIVLIDTREEREYNGQTPYGEKRGGHIPGAIHLYFKEFLSTDGALLPRDELERMLNAQGITPETTIIAYCTGGVRSAWVTSVLFELGFSVRNYAGSTWEWAASPEQNYPLIIE